MSVDNVVCVKKSGKKWAVWEDSASNDEYVPSKRAKKYPSKSEAILAAHNLVEEIGYVEYGVNILDDPH